MEYKMKKYLSLLLASLAISPLFSQETTQEPKEEKLVASNEVAREEVATEESTQEPAIEEKMADLEEAEETKEEESIEE
jgi:hypothetical protein